MIMTPRTFMAGTIKTHEGGLSMNANDNGNWFDKARYKAGLGQKRGAGTLVGSKYGVTAYALASFTNDNDILPWEMAALTFDTAVDIAEQIYVKAPRFNLLIPSRVTLSIIDKGWGSGPGQATKLLQRLLGMKNVDGKMGPATAAAYEAWHARVGEEEAARLWAAERIKFDTMLATNDGPKDPDRIFLKGWNNRSNSFLPGTPWWKAAA